MKYISTLIIASCLLLGCQNAEQYREQIEGLVASWQESSATANSLSTSLEQEQQRAQLALTNMNVPEGFKLSPTQLQQANSLKDLVQRQMTKIINVRQEVGAFAKTAQDNAQTMNKLKAELESGKLPGNVATTLASLQESATGATASLGRWEANMQEATTAYTEAYKAFNGLFVQEGN